MHHVEVVPKAISGIKKIRRSSIHILHNAYMFYHAQIWFDIQIILRLVYATCEYTHFL